MWKDLLKEEKDKYKRLILAFASLTEVFAQKTNDFSKKVTKPIINSKFQETIFQKAFNATAEDIGNTSYDASLNTKNGRYLIGIKTFSRESGYQKIAQFKKQSKEWQEIINQINTNVKEIKNKYKDPSDKKELLEEIKSKNKELYKNLAIKISKERNTRIESSKAQLIGFNVENQDQSTTKIEAVYHVLMPSIDKNNNPIILVGEIPYDSINLSSLQIEGCSTINNPANFCFDDGNHKYRYTHADSQLLMEFGDNTKIEEEWSVLYAKDAFNVFDKIFNLVYLNQNIQNADTGILNNSRTDLEILESHCWLIPTDKNNEPLKSSGFNGFYGLSQKNKMNPVKTEKWIHSLIDFSTSTASSLQIKRLQNKLFEYFKLDKKKDRDLKFSKRKDIINFIKKINNIDLNNEVIKKLFRTKYEMYIPLKEARNFHIEHPDFFGINSISSCIYNKKNEHLNSKLTWESGKTFTLVFEPSKKKIQCYLTQDNLKGIQSKEHQDILGQWILKGVFQLDDFEPLTSEKLNELEINGYRLAKDSKGEIHFTFIWIDKDNPPSDFYA